MKRRAEEIRIRHLYRNLILRKRITLPLEAAMKMVGPDCAYHLYSKPWVKHNGKKKEQ